ncbi:MAG: O-antigen ligase family protein [Candidatus Sabulitectum sp.]|nr:O-antigen ligase family protein [Candidatus Sabulitectum sp.]
MSFAPENSNYRELEAYKPSRKTWILVVGLALVYFWLFLFNPRPILVVSVAVLLFFVAVYHVSDPRNWLLLLPVVITLGNSVIDYGPFYTSAATIAVLLFTALYLIVKVAGFRKFPRFPVPVYIVLAAYLAQLASMFASLHNHENLIGNTLREAHKHFFSAILIFVIYDWFGRGEWFTKMLKLLALMLLVMSIYGIYQYNAGNLDSFGEKASGFDLAGRVYSFISGGPNSYSGVLELLVPTVLASMFVFKRWIWKGVALAATLLGVQNVMYTFSRGGFLTVTTACFIYLVYRYRKKIWVPVLALAIFTGVLFSNADEFKRQLTVFGDTRSLMMDTSLLHRYTSYNGFASRIADSPTNGVGWGSEEFFHSRSSLYSFWEVRHEASIEKINRFGGLNSLFLEMPYKGGIFSSLALLLLIFAVGLTVFKLLRSGSDKSLGMGLVCGLAAFGVHQAFDNLIPWPQTGAFFWLILALLISIAYPCCDKEVDSL